MSEIRIEVLNEVLRMEEGGKPWSMLRLDNSLDYDYFDYLIIKGHWYYGENNYCVFNGRSFVYKITKDFLEKYKILKESTKEDK